MLKIIFCLCEIQISLLSILYLIWQHYCGGYQVTRHCWKVQCYTG